MKLKYQTGVAALIQFIVMTVLNFVNTVVGDVQSCTTSGGECLGDFVLNLIFLLILAIWYGFLWILGYTAQDRRSRRLSQILLALEAIVAVVALFDARHHTSILGLVTSLVDAALAIWVGVLAWRLMRSGGGRVVTSPARPRRKRPAKNSQH